MSIYLTSDFHWGHSNSIIYDKRPFKDVNHMNRVLINNYNSCVHEGDTCYFLGDIGFTKDENFAKMVAELNGTKILILGNHDKGAAAMKRLGFDVVLNMAAITVAGHLLTMTHCPLRGVWREDTSNMKGTKPGDNWHGESKHFNLSLPDMGQYHAHGHCHAGPANNTPVTTHNQWDVGVVGNNYRPVSLSAIESWIAKNNKPKQ
jgi:calcineurin-like phosphoesterase family protein